MGFVVRPVCPSDMNDALVQGCRFDSFGQSCAALTPSTVGARQRVIEGFEVYAMNVHTTAPAVLRTAWIFSDFNPANGLVCIRMHRIAK